MSAEIRRNTAISELARNLVLEPADENAGAGRRDARIGAPRAGRRPGAGWLRHAAGRRVPRGTRRADRDRARGPGHGRPARGLQRVAPGGDRPSRASALHLRGRRTARPGAPIRGLPSRRSLPGRADCRRSRRRDPRRTGDHAAAATPLAAQAAGPGTADVRVGDRGPDRRCQLRRRRDRGLQRRPAGGAAAHRARGRHGGAGRAGLGPPHLQGAAVDLRRRPAARQCRRRAVAVVRGRPGVDAGIRRRRPADAPWASRPDPRPRSGVPAGRQCKVRGSK